MYCENDEDKLHDECGVVGIFGAENAASKAYFSLVSLQHRGQESAGIAVSDGKKIALKKEIGLVGDIFKESDFEKLQGSLAIGHVRYATAGGRTIENAQPFLNTFKMGSIALAHNGQLVNHAELRAMLEDGGSTFSSSSDSEVILKLIVRKYIENGGHLGRPGDEENFRERNQKRFIEAVVQTARLIRGSFALCIMTESMLIGVRDPNGIRPLCLGRIDCPVEPDNDSVSQPNGDSVSQLEGDSVSQADGDSVSQLDGDTYGAAGVIPRLDRGISCILASESCAIDAVNGTFIRDVDAGEIVVITKEGLRSINYAQEKKETCIFEYVYFARPDSLIDGISVQEARYRMGEVLAEEAPVEADIVIGVPDSGLGAAMGYARASGLPYGMGIIKNKYIGRSFIAPTQAEREAMVFVKLNAIRSDLEGKRVIVIDDSIVRGTTSRRLVDILRRAGAKEVHFRVSSPPVKFPCHLGIDTPSKNELISSTHELEEIRKEIGADSLAFISLPGMIKAFGADSFCKGCFNGSYPV